MRGYPPSVKQSLALSVVVLLALSLPAPAAAGTPVGEAFIPSTGGSDETLIQVNAPGGQYTVPGPGVITSWSVGSSAVPLTEVRLKLALPAGGNSFTITRQSARRSGPAPGTVESFNTREPVQGGEQLGLYVVSGHSERMVASPEYVRGLVPGEQPPGSTTSYGPVPEVQLSVAAVLEPDADGDGFGDETQDACPADAALQEAPCDRVAPETQITKGPKDKTKKKTANFHFAGTDARAIASFQCSLDGAAFVPCTSPRKVKVKKGRHLFSVRAIDQTGNIDGSPATDTWKVKKKKKKRKKK
jgi:hypothetical protein